MAENQEHDEVAYPWHREHGGVPTHALTSLGGELVELQPLYVTEAETFVLLQLVTQALIVPDPLLNGLQVGLEEQLKAYEDA